MGDILLSRNVAREIDLRKSSPWAKLDSRFKSADLVIGNLEGSVGSIANPADSLAKEMIFDIPKKDLKLIKEAGITALSLENNHSYDLGSTSKDSTSIEVLNAGIQAINFKISPRFFSLDKYIISVISVNTVPDREGHNEKIPSILLQQKLRLARSLSNFVIVSIHWGSELLDWPNNFQRTTAEWLIDNGADLIIGHHPHVIQQPEIIKGKPVFFSLGNHLFDQKYSETKEGLMVECIIKNGMAEYNGIITHTMENSYFPEITRETRFDFPALKMRENVKYAGIEILPISTDLCNENKIILEGYQQGRKLWSTHPLSLISVESANFDEKYNYLFTLQNHYSPIDGENGLRPYVYDITINGLKDLWRGSALSRPLLDATLSPDKKYLIALHRGDSFINPDPANNSTLIETYMWNGFGFSGHKDSLTMEFAIKYYEPVMNHNK